MCRSDWVLARPLAGPLQDIHRVVLAVYVGSIYLNPFMRLLLRTPLTQVVTYSVEKLVFSSMEEEKRKAD